MFFVLYVTLAYLGSLKAFEQHLRAQDSAMKPGGV